MNVLDRGRAAAERRMQETCEVIANPDETVFNESTRRNEPAVPAAAYSGRVRIKAARTQPAAIDAASQPLIVSSAEAHFPISTSAAVRAGNVIVIKTSRTDAALVGRRYRITGPATGSDLTARRFPIEEVVHG